jgi:Periplasmic binding protein
MQSVRVGGARTCRQRRENRHHVAAHRQRCGGGQASKAAIEVALDIINNVHPELANLPLAATAGLPNVGGANLEVTFDDHEGNPSIAQQLATRLITQDKVDALVGAYQSSCTFTATAVAERYASPSWSENRLRST